MKITINLPPDLEQNLVQQAAQSKVPIQTLVLRALRQSLQPPQADSLWPEIVISYQGDPNFPAFESYRDELSPLQELDLF
ncbi:MAG: hypothetical protein ACFB0E_02435 [Leptolyngbyaceae cyanobacterium]